MVTPPPPQPPPPPPPPPAAQPPPVPPYSGPREIRPSRVWYWIAGAVAIAAIAGAILVFTGGDDDGGGLGSLTDVLSTLEELQAPGSTTVDLEAGEEWAIYALSGRGSFRLAPPASLECGVLEPGGEQRPLASNLGIGTVTLGNESYETVFTFEVRESGPHRVSCRTRDSRPLPLLVGESIEIGEIFGFFGRAALGVAILLLGLIVTTAIALPVLLARSRRIAEARRAGIPL